MMIRRFLNRKDKCYFAWTLNLGVVPLFLFSAFLRAPIFFFLFFLINLVFLVRDPIFPRLAHSYLHHFRGCLRRVFVPTRKQKVKKIDKIYWPVAISLAITYFQAHSATSSIILATGEQKSLSTQGLKNYSVGNKEVIGTHLKGSELLIKGQKIGFSDLVIWHGDDQKRHHKIYVLNKRSHLKTLKLAEVFVSMGLEWELRGDIIEVQGKINKDHHWKLLQQVAHKHSEHLFIKVDISDQLKASMVAQIYQDFYQWGANLIECSLDGIQILCLVKNQKDEFKELVEKWQNKLGVRFSFKDAEYQTLNYLLKLHLVKLESEHRFDYQSGLNRIETEVSQLLEQGAKGLVANNFLMLGQKKITMKTVATPQLYLTLGNPTEIQLGSEMPIQRPALFHQRQQQLVQWKFIGLKIISEIQQKQGRKQMTYQMEFSRPQEEMVQTTKEKGKIYLDIKKSQKIFTLELTSMGKDKSAIPYIAKIPILGDLFSGNQSNIQWQKLYAFATLEEEQ